MMDRDGHRPRPDAVLDAVFSFLTHSLAKKFNSFLVGEKYGNTPTASTILGTVCAEMVAIDK
jgi:hypothetical protein